ncbi:MAG: NADH-quinone oxidoreductase subunit NuoN [Alphaproteobacteria bacterium]
MDQFAELPIYRDLIFLTPELLMAVGGMALLMVGAFRGDRAANAIGGLALILLTATGVLIAVQQGERELIFNGSFVADPFARFVKILVLTGAGLVIVISHDFLTRERILRMEFPVLIIFATLGMMMMVSANDLIALYVGLELQSLCLYVLAAFNRDSRRSTEAGLKYFVLSSLASGMLLYGASLIYGFTGTVNFDQLANTLSGATPSVGIIFGLVFLAAGLAFKISAVPFHMWTPDVYEGAPTPVTAFFASAPKIAAMALFLRAFLWPFPELTEEWRQIIVFIAIMSMGWGAFAAIGQTNIKRLMGYSAIGHMGYALMGLAAGGVEGVRAVLMYLLIYLGMTIGTFVCILSMRRREGMVEQISDLSGLSRTHPFRAAVLGALMFSLAGIPPLAGFFAKFYVFMAALKAGLVPLAIIGVVASVVAAFYYLRIVKVMYFDEPAPAFEPAMPAGMRVVMTASGAFVMGFIFFIGPLVAAAGWAAQSLIR